MLFELSFSASSGVSSETASSVVLRDCSRSPLGGGTCTGVKVLAEGQASDLGDAEINSRPFNSSPYDSHPEALLMGSTENIQPANGGVRRQLPRQQSHLVGSERSLSTDRLPQIEGDGDVPHHVDTESLQLDLAVAMLPLIPSYSLGSAEIWVHIRRVTPVPGDDFPTCPYVRISLHPGAQAIACTRESHRSPPKDERFTTKGVPRNGANMQSHSGRVFYDFGIAPDTRASNTSGGVLDGDNREEITILKIGPEIVTRLKLGQGPPTLRLELVSGRSVGHCDLSLSESLRRPGELFRELELSIWEKVSYLTANNRRVPHNNVDSRGGSIEHTGSLGHQNLANARRQSSAVAYLQLDFGVVLPGTAEHVRTEESAANRKPTLISRASISVEVLAIRGCDTQAGSGPGQLGETGKCGGYIGVSIELALEGERVHVAIPSGNSDVIDGGEDTQFNVETAAEDTHGVVLTCTCAELEILALRLATWAGRERAYSGDNRRVSRGSAGDGLRYGRALAIPVSDINDIFDGRARWITINDPREEHPALNVAEATEAAKRGSGKLGKVEINLRMVASNVENQPDGHLKDASRAGRHTPGNPTNTIHVPTTSTLSLLDISGSHAHGLMSNSEHKLAVETLPNWSHASARLRSTASQIKTARGSRPGLSASEGHGAFLEPGPGVVELEIFAIQGYFVQSTSLPKNGSTSRPETTPPWWVRVELNGGSKGDLILESPEGTQASTSRAEPGAEGEGGGDGRGEYHRVCWPRGAGVQARYAIHWTPRQRDLPCAAFTVFEGEVSTIV